jgi:hypothetical protein
LTCVCRDVVQARLYDRHPLGEGAEIGRLQTECAVQPSTAELAHAFIIDQSFVVACIDLLRWLEHEA